ncbi:MAG: SprT-like domain-containing protein [Chthoniobacterales bacterium]
MKTPITHYSSNTTSYSPQRSARTLAQRDEMLEKRAKELLLPHDPELAARVVVGWNRRLRTTAGIAIYQHWEVQLNPALQQFSGDEIDKTLRHELAHLLARARTGRRRIAPHGAEWQIACSDLGIPKEPRTHQLPFLRRKLKPRFFYRCPACKGTLKRVRKPRHKIACLGCCKAYARGRYDERFRYEAIPMQLPVQ